MQQDNQRRYPWKTFLALWLAGTLTSPLVIPYILGLTEAAGSPPDIPQSLLDSPLLLVLIMMARSAVVLLIATSLGLLVARRLDLGAPYLEHHLDGGPEPRRPISSIVRPAVFWAIATGLLAFAIDAFFLRGLGVTFPAPEIHARIDVAWWRSGLASFWAPFFEEIVDRLFLLSLVAWVLIRLLRLRSEASRTTALWIANAATAFFFGWYHIGNESMFGEVSTVVAVRTVAIIFPIGLVFGWLYFRRGLEAAILSHFVIDILVHVVRPIVDGWLR